SRAGQIARTASPSRAHAASRSGPRVAYAVAATAPAIATTAPPPIAQPTFDRGRISSTSSVIAGHRAAGSNPIPRVNAPTTPAGTDRDVGARTASPVIATIAASGVQRFATNGCSPNSASHIDTQKLN